MEWFEKVLFVRVEDRGLLHLSLYYYLAFAALSSTYVISFLNCLWYILSYLFWPALSSTFAVPVLLHCSFGCLMLSDGFDFLFCNIPGERQPVNEVNKYIMPWY